MYYLCNCLISFYVIIVIIIVLTLTYTDNFIVRLSYIKFALMVFAYYYLPLFHIVHLKHQTNYVTFIHCANILLYTKKKGNYF